MSAFDCLERLVSRMTCQVLSMMLTIATLLTYYLTSLWCSTDSVTDAVVLIWMYIVVKYYRLLTITGIVLLLLFVEGMIMRWLMHL